MFKCHGGGPLPKETKAQLAANIRIRCQLAPYRMRLGEPEPPDAPEICACIDPVILAIARALGEAEAAKDHARHRQNLRKKRQKALRSGDQNRDK
jgi:hypothetical protein